MKDTENDKRCRFLETLIRFPKKEILFSLQIIILLTFLAGCSIFSRDEDEPDEPDEPVNVDFSRLHGFNLRNMYTPWANATYSSPQPYPENDFKWMADWGFNFARLPLDYRCYTVPGDIRAFDEERLKWIDDAIGFGQKYGIHILLDFHHPIGYHPYDNPDGGSDFWTNEGKIAIFLEHWEMFTKRYKNVSHEYIFFNLMNEPKTTKGNFLSVHRRAIEAIHRVDPSRLIIVDGMNVSQEPVPELVDAPNVVQACRGYVPGNISHYMKPGTNVPEYPRPAWPMPFIIGRLYGPAKPEAAGPFVLKSDFKANTEIAIRVHQVVRKAVLTVKADGTVLWEKTFEPGGGEGEWKEVIWNEQYQEYQNIYDREYTITLPFAAEQVSFENIDGVNLIFSEFSIKPPGGDKLVFPADIKYRAGIDRQKPGTYEIGADGKIGPVPADFDPEWPINDYFDPWIKIADQGETVFVGEFGVYNRTPHDVTLAWMRSWLEKWKEAKFGWALWNFYGPFGILDSGREDVEYEDFHGHKLDREMLKLLQEYTE